MLWGKKEEKDKLDSLPELPPIKPSLAGPQQFSRSELGIDKNLPSFPEPMEKGFSKAAIKEAVESSEQPEPMDTQTMEMEEWHPHKLPAAPPKLPMQHDVFVKIEKFKTAKKSLEVAKEKLEDVEDLLRKIRETKNREEHELSSWEKELSAVKARVRDVTENIFEK